MSDLIGKTINQYQIVELIKDAGTALIYKGFQPTMNRYVAIRVLKSQDPAAVGAFTRQDELLAQIQHPNILPILDSGQAEGQTYRVLRYVEGGVLRDHLFAYSDPRKAAGLIAGIVAGLEKIHAQGYVHGNLEPGNIYLDEGGVPLLTDFGLPKAPGAPVTPYMSPEQTQGGIVDRRTDVYALGVLLYEILTGEAPPPGVVVSPRAKRPDLPESVEKVILKAMAQNPDARFLTAHEFQQALSAALQPVVPLQASVPQQPAAPQASSPPPPAPKRTNWAAIILGIVLVVVICGGMVLLFSWWGSRDGDDVALEPTATSVEVIPTDEPPEPTQEPEPTEEPEPTQEPEPTEEPDQPEETEEPGEPPELPEICNSTGFMGGFFLLGGVLSIYKKRRAKNNSETKIMEV